MLRKRGRTTAAGERGGQPDRNNLPALRQKSLVRSHSRACKHALKCSGIWDIPALPVPISGAVFHLCLIVDIGCCKIFGWEGHDSETAEFAAQVLGRAVRAGNCLTGPLALHPDPNSERGQPASRACKGMPRPLPGPECLNA